jgi:hypothetical protein
MKIYKLCKNGDLENLSIMLKILNINGNLSTLKNDIKIN